MSLMTSKTPNTRQNKYVVFWLMGWIERAVNMKHEFVFWFMIVNHAAVVMIYMCVMSSSKHSTKFISTPVKSETRSNICDDVTDINKQHFVFGTSGLWDVKGSLIHPHLCEVSQDSQSHSLQTQQQFFHIVFWNIPSIHRNIKHHRWSVSCVCVV